MAKVMLQTVQRSSSWVSTHLGINRKTQALEPEAVWSVNKRVRIALGKRTRLSPKPHVAFPLRLGSGRGSEQTPRSSPCTYWSRDSWRSLAACMATETELCWVLLGWSWGAASPWGSWAPLSRSPVSCLPLCQPPRPIPCAWLPATPWPASCCRVHPPLQSASAGPRPPPLGPSTAGTGPWPARRPLGEGGSRLRRHSLPWCRSRRWQGPVLSCHPCLHQGRGRRSVLPT